MTLISVGVDVCLRSVVACPDSRRGVSLWGKIRESKISNTIISPIPTRLLLQSFHQPTAGALPRPDRPHPTAHKDALTPIFQAGSPGPRASRPRARGASAQFYFF